MKEVTIDAQEYKGFRFPYCLDSLPLLQALVSCRAFMKSFFGQPISMSAKHSVLCTRCERNKQERNKKSASSRRSSTYRSPAAIPNELRLSGCFLMSRKIKIPAESTPTVTIFDFSRGSRNKFSLIRSARVMSVSTSTVTSLPNCNINETSCLVIHFVVSLSYITAITLESIR